MPYVYFRLAPQLAQNVPSRLPWTGAFYVKMYAKKKKKESEPDGRVVKYLPLRARYAPILRANPLICYTITLCGYWGSLLSSLGRSKIRKQLSFLFLFRMWYVRCTIWVKKCRYLFMSPWSCCLKYVWCSVFFFFFVPSWAPACSTGKVTILNDATWNSART